jgi:coenzyme F420 biosynthesis associated uncharacterized protein
MTMTTQMVDWDLAVSIATRVAGAGPQVSSEEATAVVAELREGAERSTAYVREFTGLDAGALTAPVLVVDRAAWAQANADGFSQLLGPVIDKVTAKKGPPGAMTQAVGSRVTGVEVGGLLGFMAGKVLGQFDPFHDPHGRLLLVAPNVVHVERELSADPRDFRLWVCLHEETHRVQFTAVPWMRDHLFAQFNALAETVEPQRLLDEGLKRVVDAVRQAREACQGPGLLGGSGSLLELLGSPEQKAILDRVTAVMSLLEGHADYVMDGVGPSVIPSVESIRRAFTQRRKGVGTIDRMLRRLLGLEAKMAQYRDGASFVRAAVDKVGMDAFNAVWDGPANLPSLAEIHHPDAWVARVAP